MKELLTFLKDNYQLIIYVIISVISTLIVVLLKKKKTINELDNIKSEVLTVLPLFISAVEVAIGSGNGDIKKEKVLNAIKDYCKKQFSLNLPDSLIAFFGECIESILSTPHKKI